MKKLALLISLLALGVLGLVACGGDDDQTAAASKTETAGSEEKTAGSEKESVADEPAANTADKKRCGYFGDRYEFAVVEGDVSCHRAGRVLRGYAHPGPDPGGGSWSCYGPDSEWTCDNNARATIKAWVTCAAWRHDRPHGRHCPGWIKRSEEQRRHEQEV
jgi:hypothetical protein